MAPAGVALDASVAEVYGAAGAAGAEARLAALSARFEEAFGASAAPAAVVRAPGRVNLIGEHVDYEGYSVLPMAIALDTLVGVRAAKDHTRIKLRNVDAERYADIEFDADPAQEVPTGKGGHSWGGYFLCGYKGLADFLAKAKLPALPAVGLEVVVDGRVPAGSGLSSSAALVCASALALCALHGIEVPKPDLAELARLGEQYIGTLSGGMDQAISIMGEAGVAKVVHFNPVRTEDVRLPAGAAFIIGNSMATSLKAVSAHERYNLRVVECRLAAVALALALGEPAAKAAKKRTLGEVEAALGGLDAAAGKAEELLHEGVYTPAELVKLLGGLSLADLFERDPTSVAVLEHRGDKGFKLRDRATHVFSEAARVFAFQAACAGAGGDTTLGALGALMDASHASCRDQYECSCPELEELVGAFKSAGALGARLTGAGWGGCAVALVREADAASVLAAVRQAFYDARAVPAAQLKDALFASPPSAGAAGLKR